jgi:membrane protein DedA with SNARE-associated domain
MYFHIYYTNRMNTQLNALKFYVYSTIAFTVSASSLIYLINSFGLVQGLALFLNVLAVLMIVCLITLALLMLYNAKQTRKAKI